MPWWAGGRRVGYVHRDHVARLLAPPAAFSLVDGRLTVHGDDFASRSAAVAAAVDRLVRAGELRPVLGEAYAVCSDLDPEPALQIDRTAVGWFGVRAAGVHLNGFVHRATGLHLWVAVRSRTKRTWPGHLDNLVAGGSAIGLSTRQTLAKECHEEAGIPADLAGRAVAVGAISYVMQDGKALKPDRLELFDLELPPDFVPRAIDGEVEAFELRPVAEVIASLEGDAPWKPNCALVVLDFLLRRGELDRALAPEARWALWQRLRG